MQKKIAFNQQTWEQRFLKLGDEAEAVFENVAAANGWPFVRTGLNRPPLDMSKLWSGARYTPDYLCEFGYVEVQGFGQEGFAKFKTEKLDALECWNYHISPVYLFLWDNVNRRTLLIGFEDLNQLEPDHYGKFPEGKEWVGYSPDTLGEWKVYRNNGTDTG